MGKEKSISINEHSKTNDQSTLNSTNNKLSDEKNNSDTSSDCSFKPPRNDLLKYRNRILSSDDENDLTSSINSKVNFFIL